MGDRARRSRLHRQAVRSAEADRVDEAAATDDLDREAFLWVVEHRVGWLDPLFIGLSIVGYAGLVWIALAPVLAVWTRRPILATTVVTAACVWATDLLTTGLKEVFDRPRPFEGLSAAEPLLRGTVGESLPSGHASTSFAGALLLAYLARRAIAGLFVLAALISFSRVYVGVHYPLDVVAGAALGTAAALAAIALLRARRPTSEDRLRSEARQPPG